MRGRWVLVGLVGIVLVALWRASSALLRRRTPDPPDLPSNYGLRWEPVRFPARDGVPLHGWWMGPPDGDSAPTLVIVHGHNGSMDGDTGQAAALVRAGFCVLLFNLRAHGDSGGSAVTFGALEYRDVLGALDWLERAQGVRQVGLVGFSMGAGVALRTAALDRRVVAVVADGTICRVRDGLVGLGRSKGLPPVVMVLPAWAILALASLRSGTWIPAADPVRWAGRVRVPVLYIHGAADPFNTIEGAGRLAVRSPQGQLWVVRGAGHRDAYRHDAAAYYARVTTFLHAAGLSPAG